MSGARERCEGRVEAVLRASTFMRRAADEAVTMIWGLPAMAIAILAQEAASLATRFL